MSFWDDLFSGGFAVSFREGIHGWFLVFCQVLCPTLSILLLLIEEIPNNHLECIKPLKPREIMGFSTTNLNWLWSPDFWTTINKYLPRFFGLCSKYFPRWLHRKGRDFSVVIRTFGTDLPEVAKCIQAFARGARPWQKQIQPGTAGTWEYGPP